MSENEEICKLNPENDIKIRSLVGSVAFHPGIKLDSKKGLAFASRLATCIEPGSAQFTNSKWTFTQALGESPQGALAVEVEPSALSFHINFPEWRLETVEQRYHLILDEFFKSFKPSILLHSDAIVRATLKIEGDARKFLLGNVCNFTSEQMLQWKRPAHLFGLRFFFPPFATRKQPKLTKSGKPSKRKAVPEITEWSADIKIESLMEDHTQLFMEVNSQWPNSKAWKDDTIQEAVSRLHTTKQFLEDRLRAFLEEGKK